MSPFKEPSGEEAVGRRMAFLTRHAGIRANALQRLRAGEDPLHVAQTLEADAVKVDVFGDARQAFAAALERLLGAAEAETYLAGDDSLEDAMKDTDANRQHVLEYWQMRQEAVPGLTDQIRAAFVSALETAAPVEVRWDTSQPPGGSGTAAAFTSAGERPAVVLILETPE